MDSNLADIEDTNEIHTIEETVKSNEIQQDITSLIDNSDENDEILINPGTYKIHDLKISKNITLQGNGNPRDIIFDGEGKSSIILIRDKDVHVTIKNITFINGLTTNFGGAISVETGNVYVDNCIFKNNTALQHTNAGAISNYGTMESRAYLLVNNSLFIDNHADHDGGAITTCYAKSDILNSVFINNSAHRDGGAIRVSVYGYCNTEDCIFMYNHADEWGGAFYSWACTSIINRCIFLNNTAGTNGGAVMISGNMTLTNSIIVNNTGEETGGSFYIQQPMFKANTWININNNLITNNTSPYGKEVFIKWETTKFLFTNFNNNDWGDENPNDSDIIDPNNVTTRSKVKTTIKSNLLNILNLDLLNGYSDLLKNYFPKNFFNNEEKIPESLNNASESEQIKRNDLSENENTDEIKDIINNTASTKTIKNNESSKSTVKSNSTQNQIRNTNTNTGSSGDSVFNSEPKASYIEPINETGIVLKTIESNYFAIIVIFILALSYGFIRRKEEM